MKSRLAAVAAMLALSAVPLFAEVTYVTARPQPSGAGSNPDGTYQEVNIILGDTSAVSGAPGSPARGGSRAYLRSANYTDTTGGIDLMPVLTNRQAVYQIDYTASASAGNFSTDVVMTVTCTGGTLSITNTDKFQAKYGNSTWQLVGFVTNDPTAASTVISFRYESGEINAATSHRLDVDCFRFTQFVPCLTVGVPTVTGPLSAGATGQVTVTGVSNNATAVTVYQDSGSGMQFIGTATTGIAATTLVNVTNLIKGAKVCATQTVGGQESCVQASGTLVGGGANPRLRFALSVRYNPALTGPIGVNGGTSTACIWYVGATNTLSGSAPGDCKNVIYPSNTWQTVSWQRDGDATNGPDATVIWNNSSCGATLDGQYGILESIAIAEDDTTDTGPVDIYIDNLKNGSTIIQDFEAAAVGSTYGFRQPSFSGTTSPNLLALPNDSVVSTNAADTGTNSLHVRFQYSKQASNAWVRLTTSGAAGTPNPEIDLTQPISFRLLMLPVGSQLAGSPPKITFTQSAGTITLNWTGSYNLQYKNSLSDLTWTNVGVTTGPYNVPTPLTGAKYYRLQGL